MDLASLLLSAVIAFSLIWNAVSDNRQQALSLGLFSLFGFFHLKSTLLAWVVFVTLMMVSWAGFRLFLRARTTSVNARSEYFWLCLLSILFIQASQRILLGFGIPNEERSLLIFGAEFHHIYSGLILVFASYGVPKTRIGNASLYIGCGLVFDQIWYAAIGLEEEINYFGTANLVCAFFLAAILFALLKLTRGHSKSI